MLDPVGRGVTPFITLHKGPHGFITGVWTLHPHTPMRPQLPFLFHLFSARIQYYRYCTDIKYFLTSILGIHARAWACRHFKLSYILDQLAYFTSTFFFLSFFYTIRWKRENGNKNLVSSCSISYHCYIWMIFQNGNRNK